MEITLEQWAKICHRLTAYEAAMEEADKQWKLYISGKVSSLAPAMKHLAEILNENTKTPNKP